MARLDGLEVLLQDFELGAPVVLGRYDLVKESLERLESCKSQSLVNQDTIRRIDSVLTMSSPVQILVKGQQLAQLVAGVDIFARGDFVGYLLPFAKDSLPIGFGFAECGESLSHYSRLRDAKCPGIEDIWILGHGRGIQTSSLTSNRALGYFGYCHLSPPSRLPIRVRPAEISDGWGNK